MNKALEKFRLAFSIAPKEILALIRSFSKKQSTRSLPKASKSLLKKIKVYQKQLQTTGLPPYLEAIEVNPYIQTGIFLKADAKPLKAGTFIGIYTGEYELVFADETKDNHYAYDVAQEIKIKKEFLNLINSLPCHVLLAD